MDTDSLLALRVHGADLSPDHGFPARLVPSSPLGVAVWFLGAVVGRGLLLMPP
jgi:Oxidoreductase molybdopterin binding domain